MCPLGPGDRPDCQCLPCISRLKQVKTHLSLTARLVLQGCLTNWDRDHKEIIKLMSFTRHFESLNVTATSLN